MANASGFDHRSFDRSLLALGRHARINAELSIKQANRLLADRVFRECPVDTGKLRKSIKVEDMRRGPLGVSQEVTVGRTDERQIVGFVHDGTVYQDANPFFDRAVAATDGERRSIIARGMAAVGRLGT